MDKKVTVKTDTVPEVVELTAEQTKHYEELKAFYKVSNTPPVELCKWIGKSRERLDLLVAKLKIDIGFDKFSEAKKQNFRDWVNRFRNIHTSVPSTGKGRKPSTEAELEQRKLERVKEIVVTLEPEALAEMITAEQKTEVTGIAQAQADIAMDTPKADITSEPDRTEFIKKLEAVMIETFKKSDIVKIYNELVGRHGYKLVKIQK